MRDRYVIARKDIQFIYGSNNKAFITVRKGQKWWVTGLPSTKVSYFSLYRLGVTIQVMRDDYIGKFKEVNG